jgi:hypothetical protein
MSTNLDEIAKELYALGIEVKINKERELVSSGEIRERIMYLKAKGDNVDGILYPTLASLDLYGEFKTEKDDKLIEYVKKRYKHTIPREVIVIPTFVASLFTILLLYLSTK